MPFARAITEVAFLKAGGHAPLVAPSSGGQQRHSELTHPASLEMEEFLEMDLGDMWKSESDWKGLQSVRIRVARFMLCSLMRSVWLTLEKQLRAMPKGACDNLS